MNQDIEKQVAELKTQVTEIGLAMRWGQGEKARVLMEVFDAALRTALAAHPIEPEGWMPIETAPKVRKAHLVWCPEYKNTYVVSWDETYERWVHFGGGDKLTETPSHWQPLPPPPALPAKEAT